jgi:glycosyltransferase involved in cell wall biosynthesis
VNPIVLNARAAARPRVTGVERWAREVIPRLKELRPEKYVVLAPPGTRASRLPGHAWEQLVLPARAARLAAELVFSPANLAPLAWHRTVVVVHDAAVLGQSSAYTAGYRAWHRRVGLVVARRALAVITVSDFSRRELLELAGLDPRKVVVVGGGVDGRFRPDADPAPVRARLGLKKPYVLTVGTRDRRKNLPAVDAAAAALNSIGIEVVWAGDARGHIIAERKPTLVRELGYVEDHDLPALYGGALAFVLPSRYEGFGLPCLEAMACGTPVVAADRGALPETCGGAALLVDPDNANQLAEAVVRAATDHDVRTRLREAGLNRAATASWDQTARRIDEMLIELGDGWPRTRGG